MTDILDHHLLDRLVSAFAVATESASRGIPSGAPLTIAEPVAGGSPLLPGAGARGVTATLTPARGRLCLLLAADVAEAIEDGPVGRQELADALRLALMDAGDALAPSLDGHVEIDVPLSTGETIPEPGALRLWATVHDAGRHVATLVLALEEVGAPALSDRAAFEPLTGDTAPGGGSPRSLDLLHDVEMSVTVELGRTRMLVRDLLALAPGAVVELDRTAGSPVDVLVNGTLIARGEVVVIDDEFAVRITEIVPGAGGRPRASD